MAYPEMASAGAAHSSSSTATVLRRVFAGATLIVLAAACVAVAVNRSSYDAPNALLSEGKGVSITKGAQALAFGDADGFKSSKTAEVREGSVRNGVAPDFKAPLGNLGKVGLAHKAAVQPTQALAFGDADKFKTAKDAAKREGSVRNGVAPDFKAPLGNLGKIGLAHKGSKNVQQALAFGDADGFKPSKDASAREGSVRDGVKPDFHAPLGNLGKTGLAAAKKHGDEMSDIAAREDVENFYKSRGAAAADAISRLAKKKAALSHSDASSQLMDYYDSLSKESKKEHDEVVEKAKSDEKRSDEEREGYFDKMAQSDAEKHQEAIKRQLADDAALRKLSEEQAEESAAAHGGSKAEGKASESASEKKASTQSLSWEGGIFAKHKANKHGFHPTLMARGGETRKELQQARAIAKNDLDDCAFTLC